MLDIKSAADACEKAIAGLGAKKYSFSTVEGETREFNVDGGKFTLFRTLFDNAVSITLYRDGKKGSAVTNRFEEDAIVRAAADADSAAQAADADEAWDIAPKYDFPVKHDGVYDADLDLLFSRTRELLEDIKARHPKIIVEQLIIAHSRSHRIYKNSNGTVYENFSGEYEVSVMFSAHEGEESTSFFGSGFTTLSLDRPFIELSSLERDLTDVENQLHPRKLEGKFTGTMILTPATLNEFMGNIIGNFASDGVILDETSIWREKLGEKVADERITVTVDPRHESVVCGENMTAEGFPSASFDLIKDGVLKNFHLSLYVSNKTGFDRAPCSSLPCIIKAGDTPLDDIIASTEHGIIVGRFSGGEPGISGDFSGVAKNSFLVEGGKITGAVSEAMISGNLAQMLNDIIAVSRETVSDGDGIAPYMAFGGITVSGK